MLTLVDLRKRFGELTAVDGVSLHVERGEVFGLLGPNGAGKSTTISLCVGLLKPDGGEVRLDGAGSPDDPSARRLLGVAPQALALYEELTGEENLRFFARLQGLDRARARSQADRVLELVGLSPRRHDRVKVYSGGMKRRLNLAVAMIHDPPLLLLDEPTAGVDPQSRNNLLDVVRTLAEAGKAVVYTTHYMEEASKLCQRVGIIDHGKVLACGGVQELISQHGGDSVVTIVRPGGSEQRIATHDPTRELHRVLTEAGSDVDTVRVDRPDLESVFLHLTGRTLRD
jgi:ABC-2 type transport system ATP-binding protein